MSFISAAYAMGAGQPAGGEGNALQSFMPMILIFAVFYFLLIRPQQKRAKEQKLMIEGLKRGDAVMTSGGFLGRIVEMGDDGIVLVDLGETKVRVLKSTLTTMADKKQAPPMKKEKKGKKDAVKEAPVKEEAVAAEVVAESAPAAEATAASEDSKDKPSA